MLVVRRKAGYVLAQTRQQVNKAGPHNNCYKRGDIMPFFTALALFGQSQRRSIELFCGIPNNMFDVTPVH